MKQETGKDLKWVINVKIVESAGLVTGWKTEDFLLILYYKAFVKEQLQKIE